MTEKQRKKQTTALVEKDNTGHRWQEGHPRFGGRKKNTVAHARALAEELGVDPLRFLLKIVRDGSATRTVIENGRKTHITVEVPLEMRVDAAKHVSRFLHPVLSAAQAQVDVDVQVDGQVDLPTGAILANPTLLASLTELAMLVAEQGTLEDGQLCPARLPAGMTGNVIDD